MFSSKPPQGSAYLARPSPRAASQPPAPAAAGGARALSACSALSGPLPTDMDVITKFAQLEFQLGDAERAKAIFENMLSTYPKRTDVWSVFIDLTIKHSSQKEIR